MNTAHTHTGLPQLQDHELGPPEVVAAIRQRRGGGLLELDRILLHSPPVAAGWNHLFGNLRTQLELPPRLRELAMCAVAVLNGADYELLQHAPLYLGAGGTQAQLDALVAAKALLRANTQACAQLGEFDEPTRAALAFVVESTVSVQVSAGTYAAARAALGSDRLLFELLAVTAGYNMVSRVLVGAGLHQVG